MESDLHPYDGHLAGAPEPKPDEALNSWLSRVALSQGATFAELRRHYGWLTYDADLHLSWPQLQMLSRICGVSVRSMQRARREMLRIDALFGRGNSLVLRDKCRSRYRFCRACLRAQTTKYFPQHWRFTAYRVCFRHRCWLDEGCPHCHRVVRLPCDMVDACGKLGVPTLEFCLHCGERLSHGYQQLLGNLDTIDLPQEKLVALKAGWKYVTALLNSQSRVAGDSSAFWHIVRLDQPSFRRMFRTKSLS